MKAALYGMRSKGNSKYPNNRPVASEEIPLTSRRTWSGDTSTDDEGSPRHIPYHAYQGGSESPLHIRSVSSLQQRSVSPRGSPIHQPTRRTGAHMPSPLASPCRTNNLNHNQYR